MVKFIKKHIDTAIIVVCTALVISIGSMVLSSLDDYLKLQNERYNSIEKSLLELNRKTNVIVSNYQMAGYAYDFSSDDYEIKLEKN